LKKFKGLLSGDSGAAARPALAAKAGANGGRQRRERLLVE
jgi:hypothetical protein